MRVEKLDEAGFDSALYGFSLSYRPPGLTRKEWWTPEKRHQIKKTALANADRDGGHNKFLEHMMVWISVTATLEFWKQIDTYRVGVSKQSESTMHTLDSDNLHTEAFDIKAEEFNSLDDCQVYLQYLKMVGKQPSRLKSKALPQAYLQEREIVLSYKVIRHIIRQRRGHKLPDWEEFIEQLTRSLDYPEFLKLEN